MDANLLKKIRNSEVLVKDLSIKELSDFCELANKAYRAGKPIISDEDYDFIFLKSLKIETLITNS